MKALIVDDSRFIVEGIHQGVCWEKLGIEAVFKSYNKTQALNLFREHLADIIICDIEMPGGNGFELVEEIRSMDLPVQVLFLTSYPDFQYAQRAIKLGTVDYLLKPVEFHNLEDAIRKALEIQKKQLEQAALKNKARNIEKGMKSLKNYFWKVLLDEVYQGDNADVLCQAESYGLEYDGKERFLPLLLRIHIADEKLEQKNYNFILHNIVQELFGEQEYCLDGLVRTGKRVWVFVFRILKQKENLMEDVLEKCRACIDFIQNRMKCGSVFWAGEESGIADILPVVKHMQNVEMEYASTENVALQSSLSEPSRYTYQMNQSAAWESILREKGQEQLKQKISEYLRHTLYHNEVNRIYLAGFRLDMQQMIYSVLKEKGIMVNKFLADNENGRLFERSLFSVADMENYMFYLIDKSCEQMRAMEETRTVMDTIVSYIDKNLDKEITRENLAELVYLTPDYISKLFRRKTGMSFGEYIQRRKIQEAQNLLENTDMSIGDVALCVGFSSFSYFSKTFKKITGMTPGDFRKKR